VNHSAPLDVAKTFSGKRLFVIGGTGFLGKVWLSLILDRYPDLGKMYLAVRAKKGGDSEARFWSEIAASRPFDPLRSKYPGVAYEDLLREKVQPLDLDVSKPYCGLTRAQLDAFRGTVAAVVNVAGVVDFDPPLDEAMLTNARGVENLVALARELGDVPILHTSTCYVAGYRRGRIPEDDPRVHPYPRFGDVPGEVQWDPTREIAEGLDVAASIKRHADDRFRAASYQEQARKNLEKKGEPARGAIYEAEVKKVKDRYISDETGREGTARAKYWGWPNTYTYTKSLGEQILAASGLPFTIVRPAVVESSIRYPFPGWNEGINTMAPITYLFLKGHMQVPWGEHTSLDVIPVDMVCAGMLLALAALIEGTAKPVYQLGSSGTNAISMTRMIELCGLYKRMHYLNKGKGNPAVNFVQAHWEPTPVTKEQFFSRGAPAIAKAVRGVSSFLRKAAVGPAAAVARPATKALDAYADVAQRSGDIFTLFVPFTAETEYVFLTGNADDLAKRITPEDREKIDWDPAGMDWRHYLHDVHLPGLEKWVLPELDDRINRPTKPLRAFVSLVDLLDEAAGRHEHHTALMRLQSDGLARVTYREWKRRSDAVAARLADAGVEPGDRVLLSAANHPDWPIAYFGILRAGAVAVPVDAAMEAAGLDVILRASKAAAAIVDEKVAARIATLSGITAACFDLHAVAVDDDAPEAPPVPVANADAIASIIYTSGTTGTPKGVMLTHGNFTSLLAALAPVFPLSTGDRMLSVLPLHHTFEFTCGMLLPLARGAQVLYLDEVTGERVVKAMREARVTAMVGVPALWQLLERRIFDQVRARGAAAETVFDMALAFNKMLGEKIGADVGKVLFGAVHDGLGGNLRYLISGGAALPKDTAQVFQSLGLPLAEGYGLTEAAPVLSVAKATPGSKHGTVGKPIPGVEIKIGAPDAAGVGEVLARGPNVMVGYADDAEGTAKALDADGWLHTGDLGTINKKGELTIVGRSKDVIVSASGENLYPDDVERALGEVTGIKELCVVGIADAKGGERAALLAVPDLTDVPDEERSAKREKALKHLRAAVRELPPAGQPAVVLPYDAELPRTATRKVKRAAVRPIAERIVAASTPVRSAKGAAKGVTAVRQAVAAIARKDVGEITAATRLKADLGFDSLMMTELSVALEAVKGPKVLPENINAIETVGDLEAALDVAEHQQAEARTVKVDDDQSDAPEIPHAVRDVVKAGLAVAQREFYGQVMNAKVTGRAYVPHNRNTLVVANHASHLDMGLVKYALGTYGRDLVTVAAKDYFFDTPLRRAFSENFTNLVPFDREGGGTDLRQTLREVGNLLEEGKTVLIFPEGTRSPDGGIREFKGAIGHLVAHHKVDMLPLYLGGTYDALPRNAAVPRKRDVTAKIGPALRFEDIERLTRERGKVERVRLIAKLAQRAVEALRDGSVLNLAALDALPSEGPAKHPLVALFEELPGRFIKGRVDGPVSFYFSLGNDPEGKWTLRLTPETCELVNAKPDGGTADCVLKTTPEMFTRIVREAYEPGVAEFMSGVVKSNDVALLQTFTRAFRLG
jgi:long-chain acyl-CoA synthetase